LLPLCSAPSLYSAQRFEYFVLFFFHFNVNPQMGEDEREYIKVESKLAEQIMQLLSASSVRLLSREFIPN
jgi:hypothetical protein